MFSTAPPNAKVQFNDMGLCLNAVGTITVVGVNMNAQKYIDIMYTCGQLLQDIFLGKIISTKIIIRSYTELVLRLSNKIIYTSWFGQIRVRILTLLKMYGLDSNEN